MGVHSKSYHGCSEFRSEFALLPKLCMHISVAFVKSCGVCENKHDLRVMFIR